MSHSYLRTNGNRLRFEDFDGALGRTRTPNLLLQSQMLDLLLYNRLLINPKEEDRGSFSGNRHRLLTVVCRIVALAQKN
jgi:hypothetical protein